MDGNIFGGLLKMFDYLIVGAGLYGSIVAHEMKKADKSCLVIDKRNHVGGNIYTYETKGIQVHTYGAHIFHTNEQHIANYFEQFASFNRFTNSPLARYKNSLYNLPFNMNTFYQLWGVKTPKEAKAVIDSQVNKNNSNSKSNLEKHVLSIVGKDIYEILIKGYTEKQWGKKAKDLPPSIIQRLPIRFTFDNNYFNDRFQGIPIGGYTQIIEKMLDGVQVELNCDYFLHKKKLNTIAKNIVFTGPIDQYFDYCYGPLEYRSLKFETEILEVDNYQGNAVINYTDYDVPYTRIIEHKHFEFGQQQHTVITKEYPAAWSIGEEPYYPIADEINRNLYKKYMLLGQKENNLSFGGRLGLYKYFDMQDVIKEALLFVEKQKGRYV